MRTLILALLLSGTAAFAQTAGDATRGNTPPGRSQDGSGPADGAIKGSSILPGQRLKRCDELSGALREDCLAKERSAAGGASAPSEREKDLKRSRD